MDNLFSLDFLEQIRYIALEIAKSRRGEDHMHSIAILQAKFQAEQQELLEASEQWDEIPDVVYYSGCMQIVDAQSPQARKSLLWLQFQLERRCISAQQAQDGTRAKYWFRLEKPKNIQLERAAILAAVRDAH